MSSGSEEGGHVSHREDDQEEEEEEVESPERPVQVGPLDGSHFSILNLRRALRTLLRLR
jgi:hypothetical protein